MGLIVGVELDGVAFDSHILLKPSETSKAYACVYDPWRGDFASFGVFCAWYAILYPDDTVFGARCSGTFTARDASLGTCWEQLAPVLEYMALRETFETGSARRILWKKTAGVLLCPEYTTLDQMNFDICGSDTARVIGVLKELRRSVDLEIDVYNAEPRFELK